MLLVASAFLQLATTSSSPPSQTPTSATQPSSGSGNADASDPGDSALNGLFSIFEDEEKISKQTSKVAAGVELTANDSPAVVTILTREQLVRSGAQYLLDALLLVPGFQVGVDVQGVLGLGFRGLWGHEGRILLLIDDMEANEPLYGAFQYAQHIPVDLLERIEILRGPGSATYGGYAEFAVIRVVTRRGRDLHGVSATAFYGEYARGPGRGTLSVSAGDYFEKQKLEYSINGAFGLGHFSDGTYTDLSGATADLYRNSQLIQGTVSGGVTWRGLHVQLLYDDINAEGPSPFGPVTPPTWTQFITAMGEARYDWKVKDNFTVTPRVYYKYSAPWRDLYGPLTFYNKNSNRTTAGVTTSWNITKDINLLDGVEGRFDQASLASTRIMGDQTLFGGTAYAVAYENFAAFAQIYWRNPIVNVTAGGRFEYHSAFGASAVPRLALTHSFGPVNVKLIYNQTFHTPLIENLNVNPQIKPELMNAVEGEVAVDLTPDMRLSVNGFFGKVQRPIIYGYNAATDSDEYFNSTSIGTSGVEAEYRFRYSFGQLTANYSWYTASGQNQVVGFAVPNHSSELLGMASHKVGLNASFNLYFPWLVATTSGEFFSRRAAQTSADADGNPIFSTLPETFMVNVGLFVRGVPVKRLDIGFIVANVVGKPLLVPQPYVGEYGPLPMQSREYDIKISYAFDRTDKP